MFEVIFIFILLIIIFNTFSYLKSNNKSNYSNNKVNNINSYNKNINILNIEELFDLYYKEPKCPPLDSLVRWAYEKGKIFSGKNRSSDLDEEDKKVILKIAISIGNKRKKDNKSKRELFEKKDDIYNN